MADDFSSTTNTAGAVGANGAPVSGNIESRGDVDWFKVRLTAGATYGFQVEGAALASGTLSTPIFSIFDSQGKTLAQHSNTASAFDSSGIWDTYDYNAGGIAALQFKAVKTGDYFIAVGGGNGTGTYEVRGLEIQSGEKAFTGSPNESLGSFVVGDPDDSDPSSALRSATKFEDRFGFWASSHVNRKWFGTGRPDEPVTHAGLDFDADLETPILALADGKVVRTSNQPLGDPNGKGTTFVRDNGAWAIVEHSTYDLNEDGHVDSSDVFYTAYLHLDPNDLASVNSQVIAGATVVGKVGKTTFGAHGHIEARNFSSVLHDESSWYLATGVKTGPNIYLKGSETFDADGKIVGPTGDFVFYDPDAIFALVNNKYNADRGRTAITGQPTGGVIKGGSSNSALEYVLASLDRLVVTTKGGLLKFVSQVNDGINFVADNFQNLILRASDSSSLILRDVSAASALTGALSLVGGVGKDNWTFAGLKRQATLDAGSGSDTATFDFSAFNTTVDSRAGANNTHFVGAVSIQNVEKLKITGGSVADSLVGIIGSTNVLAGGAGDDGLEVSGGRGSLSGGAGNDSILANVQLFGAAAGIYAIDGGTGIDSLFLRRNDLLQGVVVRLGHEGNHLAYAAHWADGTSIKNVEFLNLSTGSGNDTVSFNTTGGVATQAWDAGGGTDTAIFDFSSLGSSVGSRMGGNFGHIVESATTAFAPILIYGVEKLIITGSQTDDALVGIANGVNVLSGGLNNDVLEGGSNKDTLAGGHGDDVLYGRGGNDILKGEIGSDELLGGDGNDSLSGGASNDSLDGGSGQDRLSGDSGGDSLRGGEGRDRFIFSELTAFVGGEPDYSAILDFTRTEDKIDLSAIDANTKAVGNQAFIFIGANEFGGVAGQLRLSTYHLSPMLLGDVNGDAAPDLWISMHQYWGPLSQSDFVA